MRQSLINFATVLPIALVLTACDATPPSPIAPQQNRTDSGAQPRQRNSPVTEKPIPPLHIPTPAPMPEHFAGMDLRKMNASELNYRARAAASERDYSRAAQFEYWRVQASKVGQYDLACYLARISQTETAFYWLQVAAIEEGIDAKHATIDPDLVSLRRDPRWQSVHEFVEDCNAYFESNGISRTTLIVPKGYKQGTPIAAVAWLHGLGSNPEDFVNRHSQAYADTLNVALIGVSGTRALGPNKFAWAEDIERDSKRLRDALAEVRNRVTLKKGHVVTFGFSQGAQAALAIAVHDPEEYVGSIALSPGSQSGNILDATASPVLAERSFVVSYGANEHPLTVKFATEDATFLRRANAHVIEKAYPGVRVHSFPRDFNERFPEWVRWILATPGRAPSVAQ